MRRSLPHGRPPAFDRRSAFYTIAHREIFFPSRSLTSAVLPRLTSASRASQQPSHPTMQTSRG